MARRTKRNIALVGFSSVRTVTDGPRAANALAPLTTTSGADVSLSRDSKQERKLKAFRRAQFSLKQRLERIDFEEDVLITEIEALKAGKSVLGLPEGTVFDIRIDGE